MTKKKKESREDLAFPIATLPNLSKPLKSEENPGVIKQIILGAIKGAFNLTTPSEPNSWQSEFGKKQKPIVTEEQTQLVIHLIESLAPANVIEAALASQFAITYIRGLKFAQGNQLRDVDSTLQFFEFGHQVLETLTKYRTKGAQLINFQYNHNQGQIVNIKNIKEINSDMNTEVN